MGREREKEKVGGGGWGRAEGNGENLKSTPCLAPSLKWAEIMT